MGYSGPTHEVLEDAVRRLERSVEPAVLAALADLVRQGRLEDPAAVLAAFEASSQKDAGEGERADP
jgi:hypothetical protein